VSRNLPQICGRFAGARTIQADRPGPFEGDEERTARPHHGAGPFVASARLSGRVLNARQEYS
jgi:hypothetical protein